MDFITAPLIVGIITLGIYKLFEPPTTAADREAPSRPTFLT